MRGEHGQVRPRSGHRPRSGWTVRGSGPSVGVVRAGTLRVRHVTSTAECRSRGRYGAGVWMHDGQVTSWLHRHLPGWSERQARLRARSKSGSVRADLSPGEQPLAVGEFQTLDRGWQVRLVLTDRRLFVQRWTDDRRAIALTWEIRLSDIAALVHLHTDVHALVTPTERTPADDRPDLPFTVQVLSPVAPLGEARTLLRLLAHHLPPATVHPATVHPEHLRPSPLVDVEGFLASVFVAGTSTREDLDRAVKKRADWDAQHGEAALRMTAERLAQQRRDRDRLAELAAQRHARMSEIYRRRGIDPPPGFETDDQSS